MRVLSPTVTQQLFRSCRFREKLAVSGFFRPDKQDEHGAKLVQETREEAVRIFKGAECPSDVQDGLLHLVDAFRDRVGPISDGVIRYWAQLDERPPVFTWKEFNALVASWSGSTEHLKTLVEGHVKTTGCTLEAAYRELFETALNFRGKALAAAADNTLLDAGIVAEMDKADLGLSLARIIVSDLKGFSKQPSILTASHFKLLLDQCSHWAHFRNHARHVAAREAEKDLLLKAAQDALVFAADILDLLSPWSGLFDHGEPAQSALGNAVADALAKHVFDDLETPRKEGIASLWGKDRHLVQKYFLFRRDSGFYSLDRVGRLLALAQQAKAASVVQENFYEYLRLLAYGFTNILTPLSPEDMTTLASDADIMSAAWRAAMAQPLQPRMVSSAQKIRDVLAHKLGGDASLPLPPWLPVNPEPVDQGAFPKAADDAGARGATPPPSA